MFQTRHLFISFFINIKVVLVDSSKSQVITQAGNSGWKKQSFLFKQQPNCNNKSQNLQFNRNEGETNKIKQKEKFQDCHKRRFGSADRECSLLILFLHTIPS